MLNLGIETVTSAIETVVNTVEKIDTEAANRPHVFGQGQEATTNTVATSSHIDRLKVVSGDLVDLWLFEGTRGINYIKASNAYKLTDPYINYIAKFD